MRVDDLYTQGYGSTAVYTGSAVKTSEAGQSQPAGSTDAAQATAVNKDRVELSSDARAATGKMSDSERASLVKSLKADLDNQMNRFTNMMMGMFQKQGITGLAAGSDDFWRKIASGNFTVDAQTKAEAQQAISEDGYWGVKQTSQRIFDFAYAIAGDDTEKMKEMQAAVEKGFQEATKSWGKELPSISGETHTAIGKLFDEYYKSAGAA
ncbi:MAG TPA: hypothetical protein DF613_14555 [Lachnospiraceae bacterium]|nr:hypothetical protein [Lachnospiraceae bacterium]